MKLRYASSSETDRIINEWLQGAGGSLGAGNLVQDVADTAVGAVKGAASLGGAILRAPGEYLNAKAERQAAEAKAKREEEMYHKIMKGEVQPKTGPIDTASDEASTEETGSDQTSSNGEQNTQQQNNTPTQSESNVTTSTPTETSVETRPTTTTGSESHPTTNTSTSRKKNRKGSRQARKQQRTLADVRNNNNTVTESIDDIVSRVITETIQRKQLNEANLFRHTGEALKNWGKAYKDAFKDNHDEQMKATKEREQKAKERNKKVVQVFVRSDWDEKTPTIGTTYPKRIPWDDGFTFVIVKDGGTRKPIFDLYSGKTKKINPTPTWPRATFQKEGNYYVANEITQSIDPNKYQCLFVNINSNTNNNNNTNNNQP